MKDQVNALTDAEIPGAYLNSSLSFAEYKATVRRRQSSVTPSL